MKFGQRLRQLRQEKNLTLREFEEQIGISYSALGKYERDERQPDFDTLEQLANYFDVAIDWLIGRTDIRTHEENIFLNDAQHISERLSVMGPYQRKLVVNTIDYLYLIIDSHLDDEDIKSLETIKKIMFQLFKFNNGIELSKLERLLDVNVSVDAIDFLSNHKNEFNASLDELFKIYLEKNKTK